MVKKVIKDLKKYKIVIISIILYLILMQIIFGELCPFKAIFNIKCPGCGLTHASIHLVKGQFVEAIEANNTVFIWWGFVILFIIDRYIYKLKIKIFPNMFIIVSIITIFLYFFKV